EETARVLWREIERRGGLSWATRFRIGNRFEHSDAVVAVDERGNLAALCHSINTTWWGSTGIFVDGVSIPDSASFQQVEIAQAGPGNRLPDVMNPVMVTKDGQPKLASACIGASLHETTIQHLVSVLDFGMAPHEAVDAPVFLNPLPTAVDALLGWKRKHLRPVGWFLYWLAVSVAAALRRPRRVLNPRQAIEPHGFSQELVRAVRAMGLDLA